MEIIRCGECGSRLNAGYCPMCMKRIPLTAREKEKPWRQRTYTPAKEAKDHKCITFDVPAEQPRPKAQKKKQSKPAAILAIVAAVISFMTAIGGFVEDMAYDFVDVEPEVDHTAYIKAGQPGAEGMPRLEETVLYQQDGITVTAHSIGLYYADTAICMMLQNDSGQDVTISSDLLWVNGYMLPASGLYAQVEDGDWYQTYLYLYAEELAEAGIGQVTEVALVLDIYDSDDYTPVGETQFIRLVMDGEASQPYVPEGEVLYDQEGVRILVVNAQWEEYGGCDILLYLENNTGDMVTVSDMGVWVNEQQTASALWTKLLPQSRVMEHIYVYETEALDIAGLEDIQEVFLDLRIEHIDAQDLQDWHLEKTVETALSFTPN